MKLRLFLLSFLILGGLCAAQADDAGARLALETTPVSANTEATLLKASVSDPVPAPALSESQRLGIDLSKMFQEGAHKLDVPHPATDDDDGSVAAGAIPVGGRSLSVMAYSYCLNGRTASGRYTGPGIVAVDTRVIPMGSRLYIPGYGWAVAADTGGAIVGRKIDVWFPSSGQCYQWGVRPVTIKVFPRN
jgi:3D (Asp-Asp-Asp) domain-containing protein